MDNLPCKTCIVFPICKRRHTFVINHSIPEGRRVTRTLIVRPILETCPEFLNWYNKKYGEGIIVVRGFKVRRLLKLFSVDELLWT
jgi:hypothetical protein